MFDKPSEEEYLSSCGTFRVKVCFLESPNNNPFAIYSHRKKVHHCEFRYDGKWTMMSIGRTIEVLMKGLEDDKLIRELIAIEQKYGTVLVEI